MQLLHQEVAISAQSVGRKGCRRRRCHCSACGDRERGLRCACGVQRRVQCHAHQAGAHRQRGGRRERCPHVIRIDHRHESELIRGRIRHWSTRPAQGGFAVPYRTRPLSSGYHAAEHGIRGDRSLPPRARPHQGGRRGQGARDAGCHRRLHRRRLSRRWAQSRSRTTPPWPERPMSRCG